MLEKYQEKAIQAKREIGGYRRSKTTTQRGIVECIASIVQRGYKDHFKFNYKLNGKVISKAKLIEILSQCKN